MRRAAVLISLAILGCGPGEPPLYPVGGSVHLADKLPAPGCVVEFSSQAAATKGLNARGVVGPDGTFALKTVLNGREKDGAVAGPHKVAVVRPPASSSGGPPPPPVPPRYAEYDRSGLTFEVKPGEANTFPIVVQPK